MDQQGQVDFHSGGRHNDAPLQERGRGQVFEHPAPPQTATVSPGLPMFPVVCILATLANACTTRFSAGVPMG